MRLFVLIAWLAVSAVAAEPRIDLNNSTKEQLESLPGIGPKLAQTIIDSRPFQTIDDLDKVKGIGPKKLEQLRPRVFISAMRAQGIRPAAPALINLNTATQSELEKLPEIGPKRAIDIINARPIRQLEDLLRIKGLKRAQVEKLRPLVNW